MDYNDEKKEVDKKEREEELTPDQVEEAFEEIGQAVRGSEEPSGSRRDDKEKIELQKKIVECEERYKRALADYQNLQRRTQEQKSEWIKSANKDLLLKMLPVLDTLMLVDKHIEDKGLHISVDQFIKVLEQEGLIRIKTVGELFDPHTMEAITTKEGEEGKVLEEVRAGFMLYDYVLRTAQVVVGKKE